MSEQPSPDPVRAASLPSGMRFQMLTPVYMYKVEGNDRFKHIGRKGTAAYTVALLSYTEFVEEVYRAMPEGSQDQLDAQGLQFTDVTVGAPVTGMSQYLLVDVKYPDGCGSINHSRPYLAIQDAAMDALRLHSSAGMPCHHIHIISSSSVEHRVTTLFPPTRQQLRKRHLGQESVLKSADFDACRSTIDRLVHKTWDDNNTFDKVLGLAMEYHRLVFTLERVDHAFLILMVAYEAMFKKDHTENASQAAQRIGRLLGATTQKDCSAIQKEFNDDPDSFSKMRNDIAHGDPSLNLATVASKYPSLYRHVTAAIAKLLNLSSTALDSTTDYYGALSSYTKARYDGLPRR